jgi:hypothetical protein
LFNCYTINFEQHSGAGLEHESHHHHHPHKTGVRWLDLGLGLSAAIVSLVSLWLGLHSAHSMEKLVAANSYPYLELMRSTNLENPVPGTDHYIPRVQYLLENNGVGPARIEWVEFKFKGKPVRDLGELMQACCSAGAAQAPGLNMRGGIASALIRPGASVELFRWDEPKAPNPAFVALHRQMNQISYSVCYCSVFDECYERASDSGSKPRPVEQCTPPAVTFRPEFLGNS